MTKTSNMTKGFYVVWVGRVPSVYSTWAAASEQVTGFPGARHAGGFATSQEAEMAYEDGYGKYVKDKRDRQKTGPPLF